MKKALSIACSPIVRCLLLATALFGTIGGVARAQPAPGGVAENERARELYDRGTEAFKAGRHEDARAAYLGAWLLKKHWQIALSLGDSEARVKRYRDAAEHLTFALRTGDKEMDAPAAAGARKLLDEAKKQIGELTVTVTPAGADVSIDGAALGTSPLPDPIFVDPGKHVIEVKRVGFLAKREERDVRAGDATPVRIALVAEPSAATPQTPSTPPAEGDAGGKSAPLIIAGASLGAVGVGLGVGFLAASGSAASDRDTRVASLEGDNRCAPGSPLAACEEIESLNGDAQTFGAIGAVSLAVGGAAAVATLVYVLWPEAESEQHARILPYASPACAGLSLSSSF